MQLRPLWLLPIAAAAYSLCAAMSANPALLPELTCSAAEDGRWRSYDAVAVIPAGIAAWGPNLIDGWEFHCKSDLTVTHLGIYDHRADGLLIAHQVAIWDIADPAKPLAQQTVPSDDKAPLTASFRFVKIRPVELSRQAICHCLRTTSKTAYVRTRMGPSPSVRRVLNGTSLSSNPISTSTAAGTRPRTEQWRFREVHRRSEKCHDWPLLPVSSHSGLIASRADLRERS